LTNRIPATTGWIKKIPANTGWMKRIPANRLDKENSRLCRYIIKNSYHCRVDKQNFCQRLVTENFRH
jgi:hypothetical protein